MSEHLKAYKGFDKDLKCRDFQYEVGKTYEEDAAELCHKGFHACESPLDVWNYYPPVDDNANLNRFCEVSMSDVSPEKSSDDSKRVSKELTVGAEIGIPGLVKAHVEWVKEQCGPEKKGGDRSALTGGYRSALTGGYSSALTGGDSSALTGGDRSALRAGVGSKFKGGMWTVFACEVRNESGDVVGIKCAVVDGNGIKPDTWYTLRNGEFVEVEE